MLTTEEDIKVLTLSRDKSVTIVGLQLDTHSLFSREMAIVSTVTYRNHSEKMEA